jgi:hypothetical protein
MNFNLNQNQNIPFSGDFARATLHFWDVHVWNILKYNIMVFRYGKRAEQTNGVLD